jgi:hypothetical protein
MATVKKLLPFFDLCIVRTLLCSEVVIIIGVLMQIIDTYNSYSKLFKVIMIFVCDTCDQLGSVAGPVIQVNGRLSFKDDLRSGGLLYCVSPFPF